MGLTAPYLVAVTRKIDPRDLDDATGIAGGALRVIESDDLQAVVCDVDLEVFGEEPLRTNLEDLSWVAEMARAHHDAVSAIAEIGTTVPMRFATIYGSDDRVIDKLSELHGLLIKALDRVEGCAEWSVKVYATVVEPDGQNEDEPESGSSYLMRKRDAANQRRAQEQSAAAVLSHFHQTLTTLAKGSRTLRLQDPRLTQRQEPMRMNAAYLVAIGTTEAFLDLARTHLDGSAEFRVEVGGPWPPYSFASLEST
jgi:hypothetical protein